MTVALHLSATFCAAAIAWAAWELLSIFTDRRKR